MMHLSRTMGWTFETNEVDGKWLLEVLAANGTRMTIAEFGEKLDAEIFWEVLDYAKMSAHAVGASGI